jgi:hypothetical protein
MSGLVAQPPLCDPAQRGGENTLAKDRIGLVMVRTDRDIVAAFVRPK